MGPLENKYKVSIIMPTYNRANIIKRAINSVLKQSFSNFQLIICDDGSTDDTEKIIKNDYGTHLEQTIIYFKQKNSGVSKARNVALKHADGDLIAYLDSDNYWHHSYLKRMVSIFEMVNCNTAYCAMKVQDSHKNPIYSEKEFVRNKPYSRKKLLKANFIDLNVFMHRKNLYHQLGGFNESMKSMVDWDLILRYTRFNEPFFLDEVLAYYFLDKNFDNITYTIDHGDDYSKLRELHSDEIQKIKFKAELKKNQQNLRKVKNSIRYRLGDIIISGISPSKNTILIPIQIYKLFIEGWRKKKVKKSKKLNKKFTEKNKNQLNVNEIKKIAIKVPATDWETAHVWGDYHFALALKKEFEKNKYKIDIFLASEWEEEDDSEVVIVLRGLKKYKPNPNQYNIIWNISHPDLISINEYNEYDYVLIASDYWAKKLSEEINKPVESLLQCTDPELFYFEESPKFKHDLLFVGNSRNVFRKIIKDLLPTKLDLGLYGQNWSKFINSPYVTKDHINNTDLHKAYSSCKILLNDHWKDMARKGFISNRIFDGFASGAFIISDEVEGAEEIFRDSLVTYSNREELNELINHYLNDNEERKNKIIKGQKIVLENHTFQKRAQRILEIIKNNY
jgi:glycosyltransferase involved in cell wall biosynthesis